MYIDVSLANRIEAAGKAPSCRNGVGRGVSEVVAPWPTLSKPIHLSLDEYQRINFTSLYKFI